MQTLCLGGCGSSNVTVSGASGGTARRLVSNTSLGSTFTLPRAATSMSVIARGSTCNGWWPWVAVSVDGTTRIPATKVGQTGLRSYTANVNLAAGSHYVVVTASNNAVTSTGCQRHLDIDVVTFFGPGGTTTPPPTPPPTTPPPTTPPPTTPPPTTPPPTTPPPPGTTVGTGYTCNGPVNNLRIVGTLHGNTGVPAVINLASGCTGSLSFDITVDGRGDDGVKVQGGAHDLNIGPSRIVCGPTTSQNHQDGVQVQGGNNVVFHNLTVSCPNSAGAGAFYIDGKDFGGINGVICDGCNLRHYVIPYIFTGPASNSGVRNSVLHMSPYQNNRCFTNPAGGSAGMVNSNNTCVQ